MATENILMAAVGQGGDRQDLHERIRQHSQAAAAVVKQQGGSNDLLARLSGDAAFAGIDLSSVTDVSQFVGRAPRGSTISSPRWSNRSAVAIEINWLAKPTSGFDPTCRPRAFAYQRY